MRDEALVKQQRQTRWQQERGETFVAPPPEPVHGVDTGCHTWLPTLCAATKQGRGSWIWVWLLPKGESSDTGAAGGN